MKVRDLMRRIPRHCTAQDTVLEAGRVMAETGVGVLPVVSASLQVTGMITDRDVCCALALHPERLREIRVADVVSSPVWTCRSEDDLAAALAQMRRGGVRRLPVVDEAGRLEGLLSLDEIVLAAHALDRGALEGPLYPEVVETLQAILRPSTALVEVAAAG